MLSQLDWIIEEVLYEQYDGDARIAIVQDLKGKCYKQISFMTNFTKTNLSDKKASYEVSLMLAKGGKSFRDGETVKEVRNILFIICSH